MAVVESVVSRGLRSVSWRIFGIKTDDPPGIKQLTAETVLRKLRLIALTTLCARSTTKQLQYSEVASTLAIDQSDVEAWVIDGTMNSTCPLHSSY